MHATLFIPNEKRNLGPPCAINRIIPKVREGQAVPPEGNKQQKRIAAGMFLSVRPNFTIPDVRKWESSAKNNEPD